MFDQFILIAYDALINYEEVSLRPDELSDSIIGYRLNELHPY
ncbi:hypothetical protein [Pelagihabitans pacificus]|nr:hypothetical protein [Pelagihabitans pacificus]